MNKFEQVSSDGHQMSLAGGRARVGDLEVPCPGGGGGEGQAWRSLYSKILCPWGGGGWDCTVRSIASRLIVTRDPSLPLVGRMTDGQIRQKT